MNDLSLVLCTWNNAARLRITLDAIAQCNVPEGMRWELVLVNNNCTDATDAVAAEFAKRLPLHLVHEPAPGLSRARNAGLSAATGDLVVFTDDDVRPYPHWLAAFWDAYRRYPEGHYFGGPIESEFEGVQPDERLVALAPPSVRGLDYGPTERAGERELTSFRPTGRVHDLRSASWAISTRAWESRRGTTAASARRPT